MGQAELIQIERDQIEIDPEEILKLMGIPAGEDDTLISQVIESHLSKCRKIMSPQGGYMRVPAVSTGTTSEIAIDGTRFRTGMIIGDMLHHTEEFVFFMGTAGAEPEALSKSLLNEGNYLEGYVVDVIASIIAESVANQIHQYIREEAGSEGINATNRYSPGYCQWKVSEQQQLFGLFPENFCGITLSDSSLMSPIKSVSGVIGLGPNVAFNDYTCDFCKIENCPYRKSNAFFHSR